MTVKKLIFVLDRQKNTVFFIKYYLCQGQSCSMVRQQDATTLVTFSNDKSVIVELLDSNIRKEFIHYTDLQLVSRCDTRGEPESPITHM